MINSQIILFILLQFEAFAEFLLGYIKTPYKYEQSDLLNKLLQVYTISTGTHKTDK